MSDEIIEVRTIYKDHGDYMARCPHCEEWMILEGDDSDEIRGEQYYHSGCATSGGWMRVASDAAFKRMPDGW